MSKAQHRFSDRNRVAIPKEQENRTTGVFFALWPCATHCAPQSFADFSNLQHQTEFQTFSPLSFEYGREGVIYDSLASISWT